MAYPTRMEDHPMADTSPSLRSATEVITCSRCGTLMIRLTVEAPMPIDQVAKVLETILKMVFTATPMCDVCLLDMVKTELGANGDE